MPNADVGYVVLPPPNLTGHPTLKPPHPRSLLSPHTHTQHTTTYKNKTTGTPTLTFDNSKGKEEEEQLPSIVIALSFPLNIPDYNP
jgi:hypothetical protein